MFSNNPRKDLFEVLFPDTFFINHITEKYNNYLKQKRYPLDDMVSVLNESIQGFDSPQFGHQLVEQQSHDANGNVGITNQQTPAISAQNVTEKSFDVSFRHVDGYITYFYLLELYFTRFQFGEGAKYRGQFGTCLLKLKRPDGDPMYTVKYKKCSLISIPPLSLGYNTPSRDFLDFTCTFGWSEFDTALHIPDLNLKKTLTH